VDPGERTGWALACSPGRGAEGEHQKLGLLAVGTSSAEQFAQTAINLRGQVDHLVMELAPGRAGPSGRNLATYTGHLIGMIGSGGPLFPNTELYMVGPGQWKQYPARKLDEVKAWLSVEERFTPDTQHSKDALGILAWWWLTTGKEVL
jgi:hypothetical protein